MPDNKTYPITTLRDVFDLPTVEQIELCMDELKLLLVGAKNAETKLIADLKLLTDGVPDKIFVWPETTDWIDDGLGENRFAIKFPDLDEPLEVNV